MNNSTNNNTVLVTGAAGKTGLSIIKKLLKHNFKIKAWIYKENYKSKFKDLDICEFISGDLLNTSIWKKAITNVKYIYHICPNMNPSEVEIGRIAISTASSSSIIKKFVFHSVLHPQIKKMPHHWNKMLVEEILIESNLKWTILQPTAYMQNILGSWTEIINNNHYTVPYPPDTKISLVDLNDVAEVATKVLTEQTHNYAIYELVGESSLTQIEVAKTLSKIMNKQIIVKEISADNWKKKMSKTNMKSEQIEKLVKMFKHYKDFNLSGNSNILQYLLNRKPTKLSIMFSNLFDNMTAVS